MFAVLLGFPRQICFKWKMLYECSFTRKELCKQENVLSVVVSDMVVIGNFAQ